MAYSSASRFTDTSASDRKWSDYARLFLDMPFRLGAYNIRLAFGKDKLISEVAQRHFQVSIQQQAQTLQKLKTRAFHLLLGMAELIPVFGCIFAIVDTIIFKRKKIYYDPFKLIASPKEIPAHQHAWYLNLALLRTAYQSATGARKEKIRFLAVNFLNKITPKDLRVHANEVKDVDPDFLSQHQGSPIEEYNYHRECIEMLKEYGKSSDQKLAYRDRSVFIPTDTTFLDHFFPLTFTVINKTTPRDSYATIIKQTLRQHLSSNPASALERPLNLPFLVDITDMLDAPIQTDGNPDRERQFIREFEGLKNVLEQSEEQAIQELIQEYPQISTTSLRALIRKNIACVCRAKIDDAYGIKMLPIGDCTTKEQQFKSPFINLVVRCGMYIGAVNLIKTASDVFEQCPDVTYAVSRRTSVSPPVYADKNEFITSALFQRLSCLFGSAKPSPTGSYGIDHSQLDERIRTINQKPHIKVLGKASIDLLQGLLSQIDQNKWDELNADPIFGQILQTSLFLIKEHLATAEQCALANDFNKFAQEIELVHAELSTILELTTPFQEEDFASIYKEKLVGTSVPRDLEPYLQPGLGKTAVNIFSGIVTTLKKGSSPVQAVHSEGSYFEEKIFSGNSFDHYISEKSLPNVDLYLGQFNPNVDVGSTLTEYQRRDVASDVRKLLHDRRVTDNFTVAVDITIDPFNSENVRSLLEQFKEEINEGRINFIFFSSGQKFYTLGMDNYYGAYYYMVNNGDPKWKGFETLSQHPAYRVDDLSAQWFCLVTKYAADSLAEYKRLIFENTRYVLDNVPAPLQPQSPSRQRFRVNRVKRPMDACFIDLKAIAPPHAQRSALDKMRSLFYKMMATRKIIAYSRGSFGFYHQNFGGFGPLDDHVRTIRINPGINPEENEALIEFLNEVAHV
jgi:hypothetical protein